jgi:hypothetical protein
MRIKNAADPGTTPKLALCSDRVGIELKNGQTFILLERNGILEISVDAQILIRPRSANPLSHYKRGIQCGVETGQRSRLHTPCNP